MIELHANIKSSPVLTPAQLEQLAAVDEEPVLNPAFEDDNLKNIFQYYSLNPDDLELETHKYAAQLIQAGNVNDAWQVLLSTNYI